jgi:hypothetical protein
LLKRWQLENATRVPENPGNPPVFQTRKPGFVRDRKPGFDGFDFGHQYRTENHTKRLIIMIITKGKEKVIDQISQETKKEINSFLDDV